MSIGHYYPPRALRPSDPQLAVNSRKMTRLRNKITEVLHLQPYKPCGTLTNKELIDEEAHCRQELIRLVLSLTLHIGTCTTHAVLSAGTSLPLHLPVVVWIAYSLTKTARRHRALKAEVQVNRPRIQLKKLRTKRLAAPVVLALISPILSALGADIINEIVFTLAGSDTVLSIGSSNSSVASPNDSGYQLVTASGEDCPNDFSICEEVCDQAPMRYSTDLV
jgi:hypothetical protein